MSLLMTILVILLVLALIGGGTFPTARGPYWGSGYWGGGGIGLILIVILVLMLAGRL